MKTTGAVLLLLFALVLPLCPAGAQEETVESAAESAGSPPAQTSRAVPQVNPQTIPGLIKKVIALLAPIGALFGKTTGLRIGGTSVIGIGALVLAKVLEDKAPSWVKWLLYAGGGTMFAGSGANIIQAVMQQLQ